MYNKVLTSILFLLLAACGDKDNVEEQNEKIDILFVLDNSASMSQEASMLGLSFKDFDDVFRNTDTQIAFTTTTVDFTGAGASDDLEPGEGGLFVGTNSVLSVDSPDFLRRSRELLWCETTYWDSTELLAPENQDPSIDCDSMIEPETISVQYLDCLCGTNGWDNPSGSGQEEPLEAMILSMCRSTDLTSDYCTQYSLEDQTETIIVGTENEVNENFFREDATIVVILVGDEGDTSRRIPNGSPDTSIYQQAIDDILPNNVVNVAALGPNLVSTDAGLTLPCNNGGATDWASLRFLEMSDYSNGLYINLEEEFDEECRQNNFSSLWDDVFDMIHSN